MFYADNEYLFKDVEAYYGMQYVKYQTPAIELKFEPTEEVFLKCVQKLSQDFAHFFDRNIDYIVPVPNSKVDTDSINKFFDAIENATSCSQKFKYLKALKRIKNTETSHTNGINYSDDVQIHPGYTKESCVIDQKIKGKNILLVDDMYTDREPGSLISKDCAQALFDNGANKVIFYAASASHGISIQATATQLGTLELKPQRKKCSGNPDYIYEGGSVYMCKICKRKFRARYQTDVCANGKYNPTKIVHLNWQ